MKGYIITNNNDTLRGLIEYEDWVRSPDKISFKEEKALSQSYSSTLVKEFGVDFNRSVYKSRKIGVLDIPLTAEYRTTPSLVAVDSAQVFLKQLVSGKNASLYVYQNHLEIPHYFLERNDIFTELYYYPYYKTVDTRTHLLSIDKYRDQLKEITATSTQFRDSVPPYQEKHLKRYIKNFNSSFPDHGKIYESEKETFTFDLDINLGVESWNEKPVVLKTKFTYGIGARINFPGKFHNRYLKANLFITPDTRIGYNRAFEKVVELKTIEVSVGSYFGKRSLRPYLGVHYSGISSGYRLDFLGFQAGLSLNRHINLEIGHFANLASIIMETRFWTPPRISLHYLPNLNFKR
ncbi:hypothetical protein [Dyadobacter aurulentus]|uniref:hypothetical protein n=1 Tax=Dyadobacter sp. UC 10 TaxID=2605428 RepID=UPI0011F3A93F|nr:hypothetical protein [Dyadobacter sp. UC 10]KAA0992798.1 hypothetical protein FXO21_22780 [Dyadobacter sp. UC 10]